MSNPLRRLWAALLGMGGVVLVLVTVGSATTWAQTNPAAQGLPYTQDFRTLAASSSTYPAGWQGWINSAPGPAFPTSGPTANQALTASSSASTTAGGVHNYNGKIGPLDNGTSDFGLCFAVNTTGLSGIVASYEIMTIRNPHDGGSNSRINEIALQYRVGTSGAWATLSGSEYQNNTTTQTGSGVVTPQKIEYRSITLPSACDNEALVQLRWAQREVSGAGSRPSFAIDNVAVQQPPVGGQATALQFDGVDDYATFGQAPALGVSTFTIETWFMRTGAGVTTSTGSGGITAIVPLLAKGLAEADGSTVDMNFILGINTSGNVISADYEEGTGQTSVGLNHPVSGTTAIVNNTWYHAAATFDGTALRVYLNGVLEGTNNVGANRLPQSASIQHATLGTALNSTGGIGTQTLGLLQGRLDEARIWNVARSACDIANSMNLELTSGTGLIARWGMADGAGSVLSNSLSTPNGILMNGPAWVAGAPFTPVSLNAPTDLLATAPGGPQIQLTWTDISTGETGYEVERSTSGSGGPFTLLATLTANANSYTNSALSTFTEYCYRVRATTACSASGYAAAVCATTTGTALDLGTASAYVNFGNAAALKLSQFTIEMWMRRDGAGTGTDTGAGGIPDAIPLLAKGRADQEISSRDINYLLGIKAATGVLCADFEEDTSGTTKSLNHPILGTTPIPADGQWRHVAVTYDGTWKLYLNGVLDAQLVVGQPPCFSSDVAVALGRALILAGTPSGAFDGAMDEVRVWNVARTEAQIQSTVNTQLAVADPNLVARWSLDEGSGAFANGSAGTTISGAITGTGYSWIAPAPFNVSFTPPAAPSGLSAVAANHSLINLSWTDNSNNETSFEIERSLAGISGPYTLLASVPLNTTTYAHAGLTASTEYCYRVRAVNGIGSSAYDGPACATTPVFTGYALTFSGSTSQPTYASFGSPAALQLSAMTIEMWMRRDGAGEGTNTGTGGIPDAIPLVAKGRADAETATADINYIFGIRAASGALCADFEEGQAGSSPSLNHPIEGATAIPMGSWHHVAATYDGTTWKLYLDGTLDASLAVGQPLAAASTVSVALGSALTSASAPAGFFNGAVDEVRIWNVARDQAQIQSTANAQITSPTVGLVARWALDEGSGTAIGASAGTAASGTITGTGYTWTSPGAPFNLVLNQQPAPPALIAPADNATGVSTSPSLDVAVSDPDGGSLTVTYYGRVVAASPGPDFTLIGLPDTQYYTGQLNGGTNAIFQAQTNWIVANRVGRNIAYVGQLGDCVEHGDNSGNDIEWQRANASLAILENPATTGLPQGIPYGVCVGNHDQSPIGNPDGTSTTFYNQYFGTSRFAGRSYYGGNYGSNNDNWYELFSASGMDFIVISFEYDTSPDAAVLAWADNLLTANPNRRAIVMSHFICNTGNPGGFGPQGQAIYGALKGHANLGLMLCGHVPGEGRRQDTFNGNTVHTLLSDYQSRTNGGNGWLRIMEFSPANNEIRVKTYSPSLGQFENDGDSEFTLPYDMISTPSFEQLATVSGVPSGSTSSFVWSGLAQGTAYEWYATVSDGGAATEGPVWRFTTGASPTYTLTVGVSPVGSGSVTKVPDQSSYAAGAPVELTATPAPGYAFASWSGGASGSTNPVTVTMDGPKSVTANFVASTLATVRAVSPAEVVSLGQPTVTVPVRITRTVATPVLGFSVDMAVSAELTTSPGAMAVGPFLSAANPNVSFQVVDRGSGHYTVDGVTLGSPCGATALDEVLFTVVVGSVAASGTGTVTIEAAHLRDCANDSLPTAVGTVATVQIDRTAPTVVVSAPNGGEVWPAGSAQTITWTASDGAGIAADGVDLAYTADDGGSWTAVASGLANGGSYAWTVPAVVTTVARVRVMARDVHGNAASDASDAVFTIQGPTTTVLAVTPDPGVFGETMTLVATVAPAAAGGTVEFFDGAASLGTAPLVSGVATLGLTTLAVGSHVLHAGYGGGGGYGASVSAAVIREVQAKIVASAGPHGTIVPSGTVLVSLNATPSFAMTADPGYHVAGVLVDGVGAALSSPYVFAPVSANHTIAVSFDVNPPVSAIATLQASQVRSGNDVDGTIKLRVHWDETLAVGSTVEVYRARYGDYPEYDDGSGTEPVPPVSPPAPGGPWELTGVTASDQPDEVNGAGARDIYSYVAFVKDQYGTYSAVSNATVGRPNYLLGDVSDGVSEGAGNNVVNTADVSLLGAHYGLTGGAVAAVAYLDVGPTQDYSVSTRPRTDNALDFEDLVVFALNYGTGPQPLAGPAGRTVARTGRTVGPAGRSAVVAGAQSGSDRLTVLAPERVAAGETFTVQLWLEGSGAVQALSATLGWDATVVVPEGVEAGAWLKELGGVALSPKPGAVDVALLGLGGPSLAGEGEVAVVRFRALASGAPGVAVAELKARDATNRAVEVETGVRVAAVPHATVTALEGAYPNPFAGRTTIAFSLLEAGPVTLTVYGVDGRAVRTLASGRWEPGTYRREWDGRDDAGHPVAAGVYYLQLVTPARRATRSVMYLR